MNPIYTYMIHICECACLLGCKCRWIITPPRLTPRKLSVLTRYSCMNNGGLRPDSRELYKKQKLLNTNVNSIDRLRLCLQPLKHQILRLVDNALVNWQHFRRPLWIFLFCETLDFQCFFAMIQTKNSCLFWDIYKNILDAIFIHVY